MPLDPSPFVIPRFPPPWALKARRDNAGNGCLLGGRIMVWNIVAGFTIGFYLPFAGLIVFHPPDPGEAAQAEERREK